MKIKSFLFCFLLLFLVPPATGQVFTPRVAKRSPEELARRSAYGICPPFYLRDEKGRVINPQEARKARPYSPRKTCGACHDYDLITSAYHFQQGRGEAPPSWQSRRYPWILSPGRYGGRW